MFFYLLINTRTLRFLDEMIHLHSKNCMWNKYGKYFNIKWMYWFLIFITGKSLLISNFRVKNNSSIEKWIEWKATSKLSYKNSLQTLNKWDSNENGGHQFHQWKNVVQWPLSPIQIHSKLIDKLVWLHSNE